MPKHRLERLGKLYQRVPLDVFFRLLFMKIFRRSIAYGSTSYSQTGEDYIIRQLLGTGVGFYVDIGCNHPIELSNTFQLYLNGWQGITIDANDELIQLHKRVRPLDNAVLGAVSDCVREVTFFKSKSSAVSTIDEKTHSVWKRMWQFDPADEERMTTTTLNAILENHLPSQQRIDLLTIDVEGHELQVLQGVDLAKYCPTLIVAELHELDLDNFSANPVCKYLYAHGYRLKNYATMNGYFVREAH